MTRSRLRDCASLIVAAAASGRLVVDFLPVILPDVGDDQRPRAAPRGIVETVAPGISQTRVPDFAAHAIPSDKGVVAGHAVARRIVVANGHIEAKDLAQQRLRVWAL
jgi:hypothetical protein